MRKILSTAIALGVMALSLPALADTSEGKTYKVSSGSSIQAALDKLQPGDSVHVLAGEYPESLRITTDNVTLKGLPYEGEGPVLKGRDNVETIERAIEIAANGVTIEGFGIQEYTEAAIVADGVENLTLRDLIIRNSGVAGIAITGANGVTLERVVVSEFTGVAAYISESLNVTISNSEFLLSPYGLILSECFQGTVENCSFYRNSVGIVVASRPNAPKLEGDHINIRKCRIVENRGDSVSLEGHPIAGLTGALPGGIGAIILGADHTVLSHSIIVGNGSCGAATYSHPDSEPPSGEAAAESTAGVPDHTFLHHNAYAENGMAPSAAWGKTFEGVEPCDLYWDEFGVRNQYQESSDLKTHPKNLSVDAGGVHADLIHFI